MKTRVMVKHCKSNSYNCDQCEYHRSSVDAGVKTQTYKEDQVWHEQGTRKIHELWALVLAGRLHIRMEKGSQFSLQVNAFRENCSQEGSQVPSGALRYHITVIIFNFKLVKKLNFLKYELHQHTIWPWRRLRRDTSRVSGVGFEPDEFLEPNQSHQVDYFVCYFNAFCLNWLMFV